nr:coat protein [Ustilaginoidea virens RNA virus 16]
MTFLSGVIARPRGGSFSKHGTFRKYAATLTSVAEVAGVPDVSNRRILFEVGPHHSSIEKALAPLPDSVFPTSTAYDTSAVMSSLFEGLAKKHSNFSGDFKVSNLAGVVERIARGLAADSAYPDGVSAQDLLAGSPLRIHALSTYFSPVGASQKTVFIPRIVDTILTPDVFSVLCHAVCGEGGIVATDMSEVNPATNEPVLVDVVDYSFAPAAVDALRLLGANMAASDQGELFALAVIKGFNHVLSVVAHSDEGGLMRDVLRSFSFSAPFGGIHYGLQDYAGIPALATAESTTVAGYCDALLLAAAGLVAHCDPGITYNGSWYPTVISGATKGEQTKPSGHHVKGTAEHGAANKRGLLGSFGAFADLYCPALAKLFGLPSGGHVARVALNSGASQMPSNSRHLNHASLAPFFWIEPTGLIPHDFTGYPAEVEGFAAVCSRDSRRTLRAWEDIEVYGRGDGFSSAYVVRFRGARASPFLHHFHGHAQDGLAYVIPRQLDTESIIHPGPCEDEAVHTRLMHGRHIGEYLWRRGQSPLCAPSEMLNLGETMSLQVKHLTYDDQGYPSSHHTPAQHEFRDLEIIFTVSAPVGIMAGPLAEHPVSARRARSVAARALASATAKARMFGLAAIVDIPILATAPPALRSRNFLPEIGPAEVVARGGGGRRVTAEAAHEMNDAPPVAAAPVAVSVAQGTVTGPTLVRAPRQGGSGGLKPADPAGMRTLDDYAASESSAVGAAPNAEPTPTGAAPTERAVQQ